MTAIYSLYVSLKKFVRIAHNEPVLLKLGN